MKNYCSYVLLLSFYAAPSMSGSTLSTWAPWEVDSASTAWYLKRYVMPDVKFESVEKGVSIDRELSIDVPNSPYQRDARNTALDQAIKIHSLDFECREKLTAVVRLLELAPWRKSISPEAELFEQELFAILPKQPKEGGLEQVFNYLDSYCANNSSQR